MIRGMLANPAGTRLWVVDDNHLFAVNSAGDRTWVGNVSSRRGPIDMKLGVSQLVIADGAYGYVYDLEEESFDRIEADGWLGSFTVSYLNGYFTFIDPNSQTLFYSAIEDATSIDALDFATANASPDKLVGQATTGRALILFGEIKSEVWQETGDADAPLAPNVGTIIEAGLMARATAKTMDNTVYWLGRDESGSGMVYRLEGFQARRVSNRALEEKIQESIRDGNDLSVSVAYAYQQDGHSCYVLQVPGLETTWVYDASSQQWHERAELVNGVYQQHRGRFHAYAFGKHIVGGDDGYLYAYDPALNQNAGDVLVRDRISPHLATASLNRLSFPRFEIDCTVGEGKELGAEAKVMLRYSDDGGQNWSPWRTATLGSIGQYKARARWLRCGSARDRVWHVRCTDNVPFAIVNAVIEAN